MKRDFGDQDEAAARAKDRALHARLVAHDPVAPSDLAEVHLGPLVAWLEPRFPRADPHLVEEVAIDLLLSLAERPDQFKPDRRALTGYLQMAAYRDVQNALRRQYRRARRLVPLDNVELGGAAGNIAAEGVTDPAEQVARAEPIDAGLLAAWRAACDDTEWQVVQLMQDGERRTPPFAAVLGLGDRPAAEQAREVKRVKDRLIKRLRRLAARRKRNG